MSMERRFYNGGLEFVERSIEQEANGSIGTLTGYIARFDSDSVRMMGMKGPFIERINRGAFADSLRSNDVVALIGHDHNVVVGRKSSGTLRLQEDAEGLAFEVDLPDTSSARDLKILCKRGDLVGCSFGFTVSEDDVSIGKRGKDKIATLSRVNLIEVSVGVAFPAYPATSAMVRMIEDYDVGQDQERERAKAKLRLFHLGS